MGQSSLESLKTTSSTMKMFVVLALAAAAVAEPEAAADAQYVSAYANYGAYGAYGAYPYAHNLPLTTYNHAAAPLTTYAASPLTTYATSPLTTYAASPLVRSFTHGLYNRHIIAKRDAEAEADPALRTVAAPFVRTVAAPAVRTVAAPLTTYNYNHVVSPVVRALASHTVTSYNSPNHYTAVSNGVYGPSYVAKNGAVQHVVKREAEADPTHIYNTPLASTYAVATPLTTTYNHVASPLTTTYNHVVSPYNVAARVVAAPVTYTNVATPVVAATHLASNGAHAVAATYNGWTHSSNVGVCTNVNGQQVEC